VDVDPAFIPLADPDRRARVTIVNDATAERLLTGADFDPESLVVDRDGTFWIGEEFGPFVLHVGAGGRLLEPPFGAGIAARTSRGFEGLASRRDGRHLLALLEGAPAGEPTDATKLFEFDRRERRFTGREWRYRFDGADHSASELSPSVTATAGCGAGCESFLVIERDGEHGPAARFKKVFRIHVGAPGTDVTKTLVVDLLAIDNPRRIGGFPQTFTFPFVTPESVWQTDAHTLIVVNDNNYPETGARAPDVRDDTEFIRLRIDR
jgi:hypothetical protein